MMMYVGIVNRNMFGAAMLIFKTFDRVMVMDQ